MTFEAGGAVSGQVTPQEFDRLAPRVFGRFGVVVLPGRVGEGVPYAGIDMDFVFLAQPFQRLAETLD